MATEYLTNVWSEATKPENVLVSVVLMVMLIVVIVATDYLRCIKQALASKKDEYSDYGFANRFHQQRSDSGANQQSLRERDAQHVVGAEGFGAPIQLTGDGRYNIEGQIGDDDVLKLERATETDNGFAHATEGATDFEAILHGQSNQ